MDSLTANAEASLLAHLAEYSELSPVLLSGISFSLGIWFEMDRWGIADSIGAMLCGAVLVIGLFTLRSAVKIRNEFSDCALAASMTHFDEQSLST